MKVLLSKEINDVYREKGWKSFYEIYRNSAHYIKGVKKYSFFLFVLEDYKYIYKYVGDEKWPVTIGDGHKAGMLSTAEVFSRLTPELKKEFLYNIHLFDLENEDEILSILNGSNNV